MSGIAFLKNRTSGTHGISVGTFIIGGMGVLIKPGDTFRDPEGSVLRQLKAGKRVLVRATREQMVHWNIPKEDQTTEEQEKEHRGAGFFSALNILDVVTDKVLGAGGEGELFKRMSEEADKVPKLLKDIAALEKENRDFRDTMSKAKADMDLQKAAMDTMKGSQKIQR